MLAAQALTLSGVAEQTRAGIAELERLKAQVPLLDGAFKRGWINQALLKAHKAVQDEAAVQKVAFVMAAEITPAPRSAANIAPKCNGCEIRTTSPLISAPFRRPFSCRIGGCSPYTRRAFVMETPASAGSIGSKSGRRQVLLPSSNARIGAGFAIAEIGPVVYDGKRPNG